MCKTASATLLCCAAAMEGQLQLDHRNMFTVPRTTAGSAFIFSNPWPAILVVVVAARARQVRGLTTNVDAEDSTKTTTRNI